MRIRDVMTRTVVSVGPVTPVRDVARLLGENRISGLPVVDADGTLLGVVSEADFLVEAAQGGEPRRPSPIARLFGRPDEASSEPGHQAATAADLMTSPVITIGPNEAPAQAASVMTRERVNRLPVVEDGRLVGIVTRADLVRAYVRTDEQLAGVIREDVLLQTLWLDPRAFDVTVVDGIATVRGQVDRRSSAAMIARAIALVPGILKVVSDVTWTVDDEDLKPPTPGPEFPFSPES